MSDVPRKPLVANSLWLADCESRDRALVIGDQDDGWATVLSRQFLDVERLSVRRFREILDESPQVDGGGAWLPYFDGSVDCIVMPEVIGAWKTLVSNTPASIARMRVLHEMRRIMNDCGVVVLTGRNHQWFREIPSSADLGLAAAARSAGFSNVRTYLAEPNALAPRTILPATRAAALAFERHEHTQRGRAARLLARAGLHTMAYPARIVMASA